MFINYLREFLVLAETCNYQETADRMHISQSSLSKHIKHLEEELGVPLFSRTTRSVVLNDYGETLRSYAGRIVSLCDECVGVLNQRRLSQTNRLAVAYQPELGQYGVIELLSDFHHQYPHIAMEMIEHPHPGELLAAHKCNFAFTADNVDLGEDAVRQIYKHDHLAAVLPLQHPLAREARITVQQLEGESFIMHNSAFSSEELQNFRERCRQAGFEPNVTMVTIFKSNILKFVRQGKGVAVLNRLQTQYADNSGLAIVDIFPCIQSSIYLLGEKSRGLSPAEQAFSQFVAQRR